MENIFKILPSNLAIEIKNYMETHYISPEEIRIRIHKPVELNKGKKVWWIHHLRPTRDDALAILNKISHFSIYRLEEELKQGYITIEGGHRIGISGAVILQSGRVKAINRISSFNIRIATDIIGITKKYLPYLYEGSYLNTLIIGPPQSGKTTFLRDLSRYISSGTKEMHAYKTAVVDERSEICASIDGVPHDNLGLRIDVLDQCPKAEGMMMFIRSMSPDVIIVDEIGSSKDVQALREAMHAGVKVMCTIHGKDIEDIRKRPMIEPLLKEKVFDRYIQLSNKRKSGDVEQILDRDAQAIYNYQVMM